MPVTATSATRGPQRAKDCFDILAGYFLPTQLVPATSMAFPHVFERYQMTRIWKLRFMYFNILEVIIPIHFLFSVRHFSDNLWKENFQFQKELTSPTIFGNSFVGAPLGYLVARVRSGLFLLLL
jgi:hypothetical protein